ncbi:MAG: hypothetical protein ABSG28_01070 [Methanoregula sp.]|jgi:hypothetical protein|uniref:hypothetical protein n=1 Tax=Methanoregula sp. TaxID=2052170 RepID=UPI003C272492
MATDAAPEKEDAVATAVTGAGTTIVVAAGGTGVGAIVGGTVCDGEAVGTGAGDDGEDKHPARKRAAIRMRVRAAPGTGYV